MLGPGIVSHWLFRRRVRRQRDTLATRGLVPSTLDVPGSIATTPAVLFFVVGVIVIVRMAYRAGLFGLV